MKTKADIPLEGPRFAGLTVPKGTRVSPATHPNMARQQYWVDEFEWIAKQTGFRDSMQKHDAVHYGIVLEADQVEE